jgi:hypothetical protein
MSVISMKFYDYHRVCALCACIVYIYLNPDFVCLSLITTQGPEGYGSPGFGACPTLPRHPVSVSGSSGSSHPGHMLVDSISSASHSIGGGQSVVSGGGGHPSLDWSNYPGAAGISRRQPLTPTNIPPPPAQRQHHCGVSTFHRGSSTSSPACKGQVASASTQLNAYDMSPLLQIPVLEEETEVNLADIPPLMQDKIESTV